MDLDTMVLDNDDAKQRHGVDVTYKNKRGFQPLQLTWGGKIVDALFRRVTPIQTTAMMLKNNERDCEVDTDQIQP